MKPVPIYSTAMNDDHSQPNESSHLPRAGCSPSPCGSEDATNSSDHPGHKGLGYGNAERLLVCVGPSPTTIKLLHRAKQMAAAFGSEWLAVAISSGGESHTSNQRRQRTAQHLQLAERLGAEARTLIGLNVADTVLAYARSRNVTRIVVGKTAQPWWRQILFATVVDELLQNSREIDIYVIRGQGEADDNVESPSWHRPGKLWKQFLATAGIVALCGTLGRLSQLLGLAEANIVMLFLLGVVLVATRYGRGPAIVAAVVNVLVFDFFFVPPHFSFTVHDAQHVLTFGVMLGIGLLVSTLTARIREQLAATQKQEHRTAALYRLTQQLSEVSGTEFLIRTASQRLHEMFPGEVVLFAREPNGSLLLRFGEGTSVAGQSIDIQAAHWVATHNQPAGAGTDRLPNATALFVPLIGTRQTIGAVGIKPDDPQRLLDPDQHRLLETCASLIALAIERDLSLLEVQESQLSVQTEQMRNSLLSSVSHDLRTPLAGIAGAASLLAEQREHLPAEQQHELAVSILDEADRLNRLVGNLLDLTRLQAGAIPLQRELQPIDDVIGVVLRRMERQLRDHPVQTNVPVDLPPVPIDEILVQQMLINLLDNATKFAPVGTPIELSVTATESALIVTVADHGPGIPPGQEQRLFEKFAQADQHKRSGSGLGLAICKGVVELHGGRIEGANRTDADRGAVLRFTLPLGSIGMPMATQPWIDPCAK